MSAFGCRLPRHPHLPRHPREGGDDEEVLTDQYPAYAGMTGFWLNEKYYTFAPMTRTT
jgi:hypothetical protein